MFNRIIVLTLVGLLTAPAFADDRPNIVLLMADDMGWGDVGYNGHPVLKTPSLDAMSKEGLRFDRFYAPTVCSPTRASCLTGKHPYRSGITNANVGSLPVSDDSLGKVMNANGYATGHFGKWHLGTLTNDIQDGRRGGKDPSAYSPPWLHGFESVFSTEQAIATWDPGIKPVFNTHYWTGPGTFATTNLEGDDSRVIMDRAIPFIEKAVNAERPFLAVIWFHAPHEPVKAGPDYLRLYPDQTPREQHYYGCLTAMDEQIGRLRQELLRLKADENTLVWFCSDNGPEGKSTAPGSTGPFRGRKRDLWEGGIRVPAVAVWPAKFKTPRVISSPCVTSDFLPTILDIAGISASQQIELDGKSLKPLLIDDLDKRTTPIGFEYANAAAWVDGPLKLFAELEPPTKGDPTKFRKIVSYSLYDVVNDPSEQNDLKTMLPEELAEMSKRLDAWRESCHRDRLSISASTKK